MTAVENVLLFDVAAVVVLVLVCKPMMSSGKASSYLVGVGLALAGSYLVGARLGVVG